MEDDNIQIILEFEEKYQEIIGNDIFHVETQIDDISKLQIDEHLSNNSDAITDLSRDLDESSWKLSIATYNVCGQTDKEDIALIFDAILRYTPDIIAIQGLTKLNAECIFRILKSNGYEYSRFDRTGAPRPTFEILFSSNRVPVVKKEYTPFIRSTQNRGISKYLVVAGSRTQNPVKVWIWTSHFEIDAVGNAARKIQIAELEAERIKMTKTNDAAQVIFAGDTSIPSWQLASDPGLRSPNGWYDVWREKGTSQNEKTSMNDRMDQIWLSPLHSVKSKPGLNMVDYIRIKTDSCDETRAAILAIFKI